MRRVMTIVLLFAGFVQGPAQVRFEAQVVDDGVQIGYGVAVADVDGDGKPDLLLVDRRRISWYRNPDWKRFSMAERLTKRDHVCIAARDIDGDGKIEVAVGGQWNPGDTTDSKESGSIHVLKRPTDPTKLWTSVRLDHEPTVHRMRWVRVRGGGCELVVLPLHGRGDRGGRGDGVRVRAYRPVVEGKPWTSTLLDDGLHLTHNLDPVSWDDDPEEELVVGSREGLMLLDRADDGWKRTVLVGGEHGGAGEVRVGRLGDVRMIAAVEPMHGARLAVYVDHGGKLQRHVLAEDLAQGHALACGDLLGIGRDQIVVGWRAPNAKKERGVRLYVPDQKGADWRMHRVDGVSMACEDLRIADLDGDGRLDIVAAGRATHNLKIYWNRK